MGCGASIYRERAWNAANIDDEPDARHPRAKYEYMTNTSQRCCPFTYVQREELFCRALLITRGKRFGNLVHYGSASFSFFFSVFPRGGCSPSSRGVMFPGCFCCFCFCYTVDVAVPWCTQQVLCTSPVLSRTELDPNSTTYPAGVHAQRNTILNYRYYIT